MNILMISGSLRAGSYNSAVIRAAGSIAGTLGAEVELLSPRVFPLFDADVESAGDPPAVRQAKESVAAADAVLISTPEYNGSIPGVLKNAIDWLSRPADSSVLAGTLIATMSVSPTRTGARHAHETLRFVLGRCGAVLLEHPPVTLASVGQHVDHTGELVGAAATDQIGGLVKQLIAAVRAQRTTIPAGCAGETSTLVQCAR